jgi:iron complex transport system ATP-binding protein
VALEMRDVTVRYRRHTALAGFTASVGVGEWLGVIGPNGAGKTTLLRAIAGLLAHDGEILVAGRPLAARTRRERAALVTYLPQAPLIPMDMTGFDYVLLGRGPFIGYFGSDSAHDRAVVADVLEHLDLGTLAARPLGELSGGERQRMVIARALATEASILLLDEPTTALDLGHQQLTFDLVAQLRAQRGLTVVTAMHDLTLAGAYADRLLLLHRGTAAAEGTPAAVLTAANLTHSFGVRVDVVHRGDGTPIVVPV